ncbi:hypothetical protein Tco_1182256 [Tanacetum coccineum]
MPSLPSSLVAWNKTKLHLPQTEQGGIRALVGMILLDFVNFKPYESINLKYPPILNPRLKALAADLYALTRYVDAKDRPSRTNDEESEHRLAQLQDKLPSNEPGALMNLVVNAAFVLWSNERLLENKELNAIIGAWFTLWQD